jgi:hypothetical protein
MTPEDKIVAAIDRNTEAVKSHTATQTVQLLCLLFVMTIGISCPRASASPITHHSEASEPLQHWYTMDVPMETGVYAVEVYTPVLVFSQPQIVVLDEALRLVETPEPGTFSYIVGGLVLLAGATKCVVLWKMYRLRCDIYEREIARKALEE